MASCMYRVGGTLNFTDDSLSLHLVDRFHVDYVYFEGNPSEPFLIRRIEELNKVRLS